MKVKDVPKGRLFKCCHMTGKVLKHYANGFGTMVRWKDYRTLRITEKGEYIYRGERTEIIGQDTAVTL